MKRIASSIVAAFALAVSIVGSGYRRALRPLDRERPVVTSRSGPRFALAAFLIFGATACGQSASPSSAPTIAPAPQSAVPTPSPEPSEETITSTTEPADAPPPGAIVIQVGPDNVFAPTEITASAADALTVFLDVTQAELEQNHNFKIGRELPPGELPLAESKVFRHGQSVVFTVTGLEPGTYQFWCGVDEHYAAGMHGTIVLEG